MSITVNDILTLSPFIDATVIAGEKGLYRKIENVSVIEVPQSKEWFEENELYITAFYSIKDDVSMQLKTLKKIKECNAAGICFIDLYVFDLESEIIKYADENEIPIIRIPNEVSYSSMISSIMRKIVRNKNEEIYYSQKLKKGLIDLFNEEDTQKIVDILDNISGSPIIYKGEQGKTIVSKKGEKLPEKLLQYIIAENKDFKSDYIPENIKYDTYHIEKEDPREKLIIIYNKKQESISSLRSIDFIMEIAQIRFTIKKHREYIIKTQQKQLRSEIFSLLLEDAVNVKVIEKQAKKLNWSLKNNYIVLYIDFSNNNRRNIYRDKLSSIFMNNILIIERHCNLVGIISFNNSTLLSLSEKLLKKFDNELAEFTFINLLNNNKKTNGDIIYFGVGSLVKSISHLKKSFEDAKKTINFLKKISQSHVICFWNNIFIYNNILESNNIDSINIFIESILGDLLNEGNQSIFNTLFVYLNLSENCAKTAENMNIHYNTVRYRVSKAEKMINLKLSNKDQILTALNLRAILNYSTPIADNDKV